MELKIKNLHIKNFRSTRDFYFCPGDLAILVGKNDSGKSNVLRALNLFFNGETENGEEVDFEFDHNVFNSPNRRAKEISIKVEIDLPDNYRAVNGDIIVWEKRWRKEGQVYNKYIGKRRVNGPRGGVRWRDITISDRSNVHTLLRNIRYVYVPAIKDLEYFSELRASIYEVISDVADRDFRDSSSDFERSIANQLVALTRKITESLGFDSRLALPRDLSHIFESLDFVSDEKNISLDARGDGVKARHIPLILKFMADKMRSLQGRGAPPYSYIWGYEEPENSLELSSSVELADQFLTFVGEGINQIFLTTHSPVFYNLHLNDDDSGRIVTSHHVYIDSDQEGTKEEEELDGLDERMGATALIAPMVEKIEEKIRRQERARVEVEELAKANRRKIFVEGPSDKFFVEKALQVFSPDRSEEIDVETLSHAGFHYVIDMLLSWRCRAKHHRDQPRAAGLLDLDPDARAAASQWNGTPGNVESAKCFKLPTPPHFLPVLRAGFSVPVVLESLYDREAWLWAEDQGLLDDRDLPAVVPAALSSLIISGQAALDDYLDPDWDIFVRRTFSQEGKGRMSRHFRNKTDDEFRNRFPFIEGLVEEMVDYLFNE